MSSFSVAALAAAAGLPEGAGFACADAIPLTSESAKTRTAICAINFRSTAFMEISFRKDLCVNSALADRVRHAVDREHVGGDSVVDPVGVCVTDHVVKRRLHNRLQLLVHHGFLPEVSLTVLDPFEIRGGHATGVGENIGN